MSICWKPVNVGISADAHLPPLMLSRSFMADSYTIHLTDLTHIWNESLDRAAILERAEEESTSIDPNESSQLQILLNKLESCLDSAPNTTFTLHIPSSPGRGRPTISLSLTIKLPGGLAPLVWPVHLSAASQSILTSHLTVPLLEAQHAVIHETENLKEALKDKDHVIQKLLDRLEIQGTDLGQVFPQATGRGGRKLERNQAAEKVRGLAVFDTNIWRSQLATERVEGTAALLQNVFTGDSSLHLPLQLTVGVENWWESHKGSTIDVKSAGILSKTLSKPSAGQKVKTGNDDDFQVQSSPPTPRRSSSKVSQSITLNESTDDEDLDVPSQVSQPPPSKLGKKLGNLKGRKETSVLEDSTGDDDDVTPPKLTKNLGVLKKKQETPLPQAVDDSTNHDQPSPKSVKKLGSVKPKEIVNDEPVSMESSTHDAEVIAHRPSKKADSPVKYRSPTPTAVDDTTDDEEAPFNRNISKLSSPEPAPKVRPKGGLGRLKGKKKAASPVPSVTSSDAAPRTETAMLGSLRGKRKEETPPPSKSQHEMMPRKKLGALGGRNKNTYDENAHVDVKEKRGRSEEVEKEKTSPPRATSEERAERRRAQLKRELEEKAKAPVKKKRRF